MQKATFPLTLGDTTYEITVEGETMKDVIERVADWQEIQVRHPQGATDLRFSFRTPKNKSGTPCNYYSIVSPSTNMEFQLGIAQGTKGKVFPKQWVELPDRFLRNRYEEETPEGPQEYDPPEPPPPSQQQRQAAPARPQQAPQQPAPKAAAQQPKDGTVIQWQTQSPEEMRKQRQERAKEYVEKGRVRYDRDMGLYVLKAPNGENVEVWRDEASRVQCSCADLKLLREVDPNDRCIHIFAVAYLNQKTEEAKKKQPQPRATA